MQSIVTRARPDKVEQPFLPRRWEGMGERFGAV
jgi:hypothetical protein